MRENVGTCRENDEQNMEKHMETWEKPVYMEVWMKHLWKNDVLNDSTAEPVATSLKWWDCTIIIPKWPREKKMESSKHNKTYLISGNCFQCPFCCCFSYIPSKRLMDLLMLSFPTRMWSLLYIVHPLWWSKFHPLPGYPPVNIQKTMENHHC